MQIAAERAWIDGRIQRDVVIEIETTGRIRSVTTDVPLPAHALRNRLLLPGMVNAHSHAFQRALRGRVQTSHASTDTFWTWRETMYQAASRLDPDSMYAVSRQAFLEMALAGVTCVGEFHYLHHQPNGAPYDDPLAMDMAVAQAAVDVGLRVCLLRVLYLRGDFDQDPNDIQRRFCDPSLDAAWGHLEALLTRLKRAHDPRFFWGVAAHSIRAVPIEDIVALKLCASHLPFHLHASEQRREVEKSMAHHGLAPVELLARGGVLDAETTLVHATHLRLGEARLIANSGAGVCVCPSTEADLGDGLLAARDLFMMGVPLSLGTDSQILSSITEEARRLEMHERLRTQRRNVLTRPQGPSVTQSVLAAATEHGARALDLRAGRIAPGCWADLVAIDTEDPALAGVDDASLVPAWVFSGDSRAVRDVFVGGRPVVKAGRHPDAEEIQERFAAACATLFD